VSRRRAGAKRLGGRGYRQDQHLPGRMVVPGVSGASGGRRRRHLLREWTAKIFWGGGLTKWRSCLCNQPASQHNCRVRARAEALGMYVGAMDGIPRRSNLGCFPFFDALNLFVRREATALPGGMFPLRRCWIAAVAVWPRLHTETPKRRVRCVAAAKSLASTIRKNISTACSALGR